MFVIGAMRIVAKREFKPQTQALLFSFWNMDIIH
jgi:hypothetical protein